MALRKKMIEQLVIEESKHKALEEMYFWPAARNKLAAGGQLADTATGQEQEARKYSPSWTSSRPISPSSSSW